MKNRIGPGENREARRGGALLPLLAGATVTLLLMGCAAKAPTGAELLRRAVSRTQALKSYHFETATTAVAGNRREVRVTGDWQEPNRVRMNISSGNADQTVIKIGNRVFTKAPNSPGWQRSGVVDGRLSAGLQPTLRLLRRFDSAVVEGEHRIGGASIVRVRATYDPAIFVGRLPDKSRPRSSDQAVANIWLDKQTGYVRRVVIKTGGSKSQTALAIEMRVELSRFNQVAPITEPAELSP